MLITNKKDLVEGKTYYFISRNTQEIRTFIVTNKGNKYIYFNHWKYAIEDAIGLFYDSLGECEDIQERTNTIGKVRKLFTWKHTKVFTDDECVEFFNKYPNRFEYE